jgi:hypothetical protein
MRGGSVCQTLVIKCERLVAPIWVALAGLLTIPAGGCNSGVANRQPSLTGVNGA